ncbi:MAG TPA: ribosome-associated translation inhibitor RaiA [Bacteroidales bacterium]|nr:ribosome-associated translation inhibitor RaiA [Bacteroidales bacterium]
MNIKINSIHFDADQKLEEFIQSKVSKLMQFSDSIIGAEVFLKLEKSNEKNFDSKVTTIKLEIPGYDLIAEKQAGTFEEATDSTVEALRKQLTKQKEKTKNI